jgi:hypothetical protein
MASSSSERVSPETIARISNPPDPPRVRDAGPAYDEIRRFGFNANPRDMTRAKVPSIRFPGDDEQYQKVLDESNERTIKAHYRRPSRLEVKLSKLERSSEIKLEAKMREIERRLFIAETIQLVKSGRL